MDDNKEILKLLQKRMEIGKERYSHGVRINDNYNWKQETLEEILDGMIYLTAQILKNSQNKQYIIVTCKNNETACVEIDKCILSFDSKKKAETFANYYLKDYQIVEIKEYKNV